MLKPACTPRQLYGDNKKAPISPIFLPKYFFFISYLALLWPISSDSLRQTRNCRVIFTCARTHVNFTRVNIEAMHEKQYVKIKVDQGSTFTFTCELPIVASILCTRVNLRAYSRKKYTTVEIANKFVHFFAEKIVNIRSSLGTPVIPEYFKTLDISSLTCQLINFAPPSNIELSNITNNIIMKSCILDPLPATLLWQHFDLLLPFILKIVNLSLESGHFPSSLKPAALSPLLKKANLDH